MGRRFFVLLNGAGAVEVTKMSQETNKKSAIIQ